MWPHRICSTNSMAIINLFFLMHWKTLFSIDPVKPLSIACLIHRPRKKNYLFSLRCTGPRSNSRRFRNGRFIKFEHERCEKKVDSTWTLLKCYKVYRSFKSICACFSPAAKGKLGCEHPHSSSNMILMQTHPTRLFSRKLLGRKQKIHAIYFKIRISQVYIAIAAKYFGRLFEKLVRSMPTPNSILFFFSIKLDVSKIRLTEFWIPRCLKLNKV